MGRRAVAGAAPLKGVIVKKKSEYIIVGKSGVYELCFNPDQLRGGVLYYGRVASVFSYSRATRAIERSTMYAKRENLDWDTDYRIVRLAAA